MLERAGAPGGDHGNGHALRDGTRELDVVAVLRAVAVHARPEDLAGAERHRLARPVERVASGRAPAAVGVDAPAQRPVGTARLAARVDRDDDALAPEALHRLADQRGPFEGGGVQRDLVGAGAQQAPRVVDRAAAAADRQRHVDPFGRAAHDVEHRLARLVRGRDVEEDELVGALGVVRERGLDRVAGVAQIHELHALDDAAVLHVEARHHSLGQHDQPRGAAGPPADLDDRVVHHLGPALDRHALALRVHGDDDPPGVAPAHLTQECAIERRAGTDHRPAGAGLERGLDVFQVSEPAADLDRNRRHRRDDLRDERALTRLAGEGAVEVHHVEPLGAELLPPEGDRNRVVGKDGLAIAPTLMQADAPAAAQVDGGDDDHWPLFTTAAKFSSMRSPHRWLFSGWNWVAWIRPTSIAAANLTPYSHQAARSI